jgi:hypothetical protein
MTDAGDPVGVANLPAPASDTSQLVRRGGRLARRAQEWHTTAEIIIIDQYFEPEIN